MAMPASAEGHDFFSPTHHAQSERGFLGQRSEGGVDGGGRRGQCVSRQGVGVASGPPAQHPAQPPRGIRSAPASDKPGAHRAPGGGRGWAPRAPSHTLGAFPPNLFERDDCQPRTNQTHLVRGSGASRSSESSMRTINDMTSTLMCLVCHSS
eukprot:6207611-Pleurochrysis_carterae.AAC.1